MSRNTFYSAVVAEHSYAYDSPQGPVEATQFLAPLCSNLALLAERHHLNQIWVAPDCAFSHADPAMFCDLDEFRWDVKYFRDEPSENRLQRMRRVTFWKREGSFDERRYIEIIFIEQSSWPWESSDASTLLEIILKLRRELAVPIGAHPGGVGKELMRWAISREHRAVPSIDLYKLRSHRDGEEIPIKCVRDFNWKAEHATQMLREGLFLHAYDKNSMYASAASNAALGVGDPTYYLGNSITQFSMNKAGIWRVKVTEPLFVHENLPLGRFYGRFPWALADEQAEGWAYTPQIKCLLEMGCNAEIQEGYQWSNSKRVLGDWAKFLWAHREQYKAEPDEVSQACYLSMKSIITSSIGLLGYEEQSAKDVEFRRPDWRESIRSTALARMLYNMDKNAKEFGLFPVMVDVDCLYYVSTSSSPDMRLLQRANELGGYKHKGTWPITDQIVDWFDSDMKASAIRQALKTVEALSHA